MAINFDLLISGCNTRCRHCYVNGGPGPMMPAELALLCIEKLDTLAALLPCETSFTMDNEPMNHPEIETIIRSAASTQHIPHYHHGMTSGIALLNRKDRDAVLQAYMDCGYRDFGITIHGNAAHHDEIVRRDGAYQASVDVAEYIKSRGATVGLSLMFNRFFPEDADGIDSLITRLQPSWIFFAVPNFTPHVHMAEFEPYRGTLEMLNQLRPQLDRWRWPEEMRQEVCTPGMLRERIEGGLEIAELFRQPQDELYLTVHPDGNLYVGNTGAETECLGNMRTLDIRETALRISELPGNRDYTAFYDIDRLPGREKLLRALEQLPQDLAYSDTASAIYRILAAMNVPTKIIR